MRLVIAINDVEPRCIIKLMLVVFDSSVFMCFFSEDFIIDADKRHVYMDLMCHYHYGHQMEE